MADDSIWRGVKTAVATGMIAGLSFMGCSIDYTPRSVEAAREHRPGSTEVIDAFPAADTTRMREELDGKKMALALITTSDWNGATEGMEEMFRDDFEDIEGYELYTERVNGFDDLFNVLRDYSEVDSIDALVMAFHGTSSMMDVGFESLHEYNVDTFEGYREVFAEDAVTLLYSCDVGDGGLAAAFSEAADVDVVAPRYMLIPETDIAAGDRYGEFAVDAEGRLSFDYDAFDLYADVWFKGSWYDGSVATEAYGDLDRGDLYDADGRDGFVVIKEEQFE